MPGGFRFVLNRVDCIYLQSNQTTSMKSTASALDNKSTFELAFRLLDDISTEEKFSILQIIRSRDTNDAAPPQAKRRPRHRLDLFSVHAPADRG